MMTITSRVQAHEIIKDPKLTCYVNWRNDSDELKWSNDELCLDGDFTLEALEALVFLRKQELASPTHGTNAPTI